MKTTGLIFFRLMILVIVPLSIIIFGCEKASDEDPDDDPDPDTTITITPVWTYDTGEDPYQSTPCITGDKLVVCTLPDDNDPASKAGTHCINKDSGQKIWKVNDSATLMVISPVVYNDLIIEGGMNPHGRRLSDGEVEWKFVDDVVPLSIYSNPLVVGDAAYFASPYHFVKLRASDGMQFWEIIGFYNNLRSVSPVLKNGMIYYADAAIYNVTEFRDSDGNIEWTCNFGAAFANKPIVTDDEFFVGLQDASMGVKTLKCMYLADQSEKWGVALGTIMSDLTLADGKIYAIGMQTIHCRSAADGSKIWSYDLVSGAVSEPLVTGNKVIVGYGKGLICLNAATGKLIWDYKAGNSGFSTPTLDGDKIYVSCSNGFVYCFKY